MTQTSITVVSAPPLVLCVTWLPLSIAGNRNVCLLVAVGDFAVSYGLNARRKADIPLCGLSLFGVMTPVSVHRWY